jgi:glycosyltransferase involved in cell wall biosynthesis
MTTSELKDPTVSTVIATRNRPQLVCNAIRSVLSQTFKDLEIVVVVDGPDPDTVEALRQFDGERVRVVVNEKNVGIAEARNTGVRAAKGRYIAFLDDDDEWLPEKIERQVAVAERLEGSYVLVACKFIERNQTFQRVVPFDFPDGPSRFSDYLFVRHGFLQPSTWFASRQLLVEVPFTSGLKHNEDMDWLLRAMSHPQAMFGAVAAALSIYNRVSGSGESGGVPWESGYKWAVANRHLFTRAAFACFMARLCVNARRGKNSLSGFRTLFATAWRYGSCTPNFIGRFLAYSLFPEDFLRKLLAGSRTVFPKVISNQ